MTPPPTDASSSPPRDDCFDPRLLHRTLLDTVNELERTDDPVEHLRKLLRLLCEDECIPVIGGRIWVLEGDSYRLTHRHGGRKEIPKDYRVSRNEEVLRRVVSEGTAFVEPDDPEYNKNLERDLGVKNYAAIAIGKDGRYLLSLDVTATSFEDRRQIIDFLQILRHVVNRRLEAVHYEWIVRETRDIQTSILPREMPTYRDYDIFGTSLPADVERVGGDLFDFIAIEGSMAAVVADASGHGLPAALMARDIRTAVHMAIIGEIKPTRMIARINRIVCDQAPLGRFISLFYGEVDQLNQMIYTVAGHPGLHVSDDGVRELREGGPVLGINPDAVYARGVCRIDPGDMVCITTDGVAEARNSAGDLFGEERLRSILVDNRALDAREITRILLDEVHAFTDGEQDDDQTVVVVKRRK